MEPADYLVHVNALLPCVVVYYALAIQKNVFLAVALYDCSSGATSASCSAAGLQGDETEAGGALQLVLQL